MPLDNNASCVANVLFETIAKAPDQIRATNAVDAMMRANALSTKLRVPTGLHPQWVRAQIGAPAATAIFAASNCHDPDVLSEFAHTERRITVLSAIADNPHARPETVDFCELRLYGQPAPEIPEDLHANAGFIPAPPPQAPVPEAQRVPRSLARAGFNTLDAWNPLEDLPQQVLSLSGPAQDIVTLVERARALNNEATISAIVRGYYGPLPRGVPVTTKLWNAIVPGPLDLLGTLPKAAQTRIFEELLFEREEDSYSGVINKWDLPLIELMASSAIRCDPINIWSPEDGVDFLTPEALDKVLVTKRLWPLLLITERTAENLPRILASLPASDVRYDIIAHLLAGPPGPLSAALTYEGPGALSPDDIDWSFTDVAASLKSPSDPAALRAATMCGRYDELNTYLLNGVSFDGNKIRMPPAEQVPALAAAALRSADIAECNYAIDLRGRYIGDFSLKYADAIAEHVPCAWELLLSNSKTRKRIIERIQEVTSIDAVLSHICTEGSITPATLPEMLASVAK
jgi:hypothetical protein